MISEASPHRHHRVDFMRSISCNRPGDRVVQDIFILAEASFERFTLNNIFKSLQSKIIADIYSGVLSSTRAGNPVCTQVQTFMEMSSMTNFIKSLVIMSAVGLVAAPMSMSMAEDAKKPAKQMTCKEEATKAGMKDREERKKFIKECKEKRKAGKGEGKK